MSARPRCIAEGSLISCAPPYCKSRLPSLTNVAHKWKSFHPATPARLLARGQQGCWWARVASIPGPPPLARRTADLEGQRSCDTHFPDWCAKDSTRCTASCNHLDMYPPVECHAGFILLHTRVHTYSLNAHTLSRPRTPRTHRAHPAPTSGGSSLPPGMSLRDSFSSNGNAAPPVPQFTSAGGGGSSWAGWNSTPSLYSSRASAVCLLI
jgi:hypothetical protein